MDSGDYIGPLRSRKDQIAPVLNAIPDPPGNVVRSPFLAFAGVEQMQMIASQIERAFLVRDLLGEDRALAELLGSAIARAGFGLILATADRRIVYANDAAETLMRASTGLRRERNCIGAADFTSSRKLQSLITAAARQTDEPGQGGVAHFSR